MVSSSRPCVIRACLAPPGPRALVTPRRGQPQVYCLPHLRDLLAVHPWDTGAVQIDGEAEVRCASVADTQALLQRLAPRDDPLDGRARARR